MKSFLAFAVLLFAVPAFAATPEEISLAIAIKEAELRLTPAPVTEANLNAAPAQVIQQTPPAAGFDFDLPSAESLLADNLPPEQQPTPLASIARAINAQKPRVGDVFVDFGCGPLALPCIIAARDCGLDAIGIEIDPEAAESARQAVEAAGLSQKIRIITADATKIVVPEATIGFAYQFEDVLAALAPNLLKLRSFATYAHEVPGVAMQSVGRDVFLYTKPQPQQQAAPVQQYTRVPIYANVQGYGVWNGRRQSPKNGCNCRMCNSLRAQIASSSGRQVVGYRTVPVASQGQAVASAPVQSSGGRWVTKKVCINGRCHMTRVWQSY